MGSRARMDIVPSVIHHSASEHDIIPVSQPRLPDFKQLEPYLRKIDCSRYYTNHGPLHDELVQRLSSHFGIPPELLALGSSGTASLIGLILALTGYAKQERPLCLCPSYTFVATAVAARAAGYVPFFLDVDHADWTIDPVRLRESPALAEAGLVIAVAPYGKQPDINAWQNFSRDTGLPVIIDAAASFDTIDAAAVVQGSVPVVISLHATKTFSTAEGGLILASEEDLVGRVVRALNFGFFESRDSVGPSINGKLSEYHAAVGLADLDSWENKRQGFLESATKYHEAAIKIGLRDRILVNTMHSVPYALFVASDASEAAGVREALAAARIGCRLWYGIGAHDQPYFRGSPSEALPNTLDLGPRIIGLPFGVDLSASNVERVLTTLAAVDRIEKIL